MVRKEINGASGMSRAFRRNGAAQMFNVTVSLAILAACANLIVLILFLILFFDSFDLVLAIETIEEEGRERGRSMRMTKNDLWSHSFLFPPTLIRAKSLPWPIKRIEPGECS